MKICDYPIKFYQVAASIAIMISIISMFEHSNNDKTNALIAKNDTVIFQKTDTVYSIVHDTIEIIKEKVRIAHSDIQIQKEKDLTDSSNIKTDCANNVCPHEMDALIAMNSRNTIKNDTILKGVLLSLN